MAIRIYRSLSSEILRIKPEAAEINLNIRKLVLNKHCFDQGLEEKIGVVKINTLREQLAKGSAGDQDAG